MFLDQRISEVHFLGPKGTLLDMLNGKYAFLSNSKLAVDVFHATMLIRIGTLISIFESVIDAYKSYTLYGR